MVHIVKKKIGNYTYLYLQKSIYAQGKRKTEHVAYLGRKDKYNQDQLNNLINAGTKGNNQNIRSLLDKYDRFHKKRLEKHKKKIVKSQV